MIAGPHLSGLEFSGQIVTVGNIMFVIERTSVTESIGSEYHAKKEHYDKLCTYFKYSSKSIYDIATYRV